jgi:urate oxidase
MVVDISDTLTTISEVCLLQGHNMNTLANADATRIFSDDLISTVINNVIRFVYGNSMEDLEENLELHCVNTLSVIALNNIMLEAGYLKDVWEYSDPFDKDRFYEMIRQFKDESDEVFVIPIYRGQFNDVEDFD